MLAGRLARDVTHNDLGGPISWLKARAALETVIEQIPKGGYGLRFWPCRRSRNCSRVNVVPDDR